MSALTTAAPPAAAPVLIASPAPAAPASAAFVSLRRDLLLAARHRSEVLTALAFFVVVTSLFPLGIGPEPELLRRIGPGALWVAALLATLLGLPLVIAAQVGGAGPVQEQLRKSDV